MSDEPSPLEDRLDAIKEPEVEASHHNPAERDMLIVQASRIEAQAVAIQEAQERGEAASRQRLKELEQLFASKHDALIKGVREAFHRANEHQAQAFEQWGQRLTELESTNRLLAKVILGMTMFIMALLGWEFFR